MGGDGTSRAFRLMASGCAVLLATLSAAPSGHGTPLVAPAFAVVELFTSEGCSSCPPAEALLGDLAAEARSEGLAIYCLAFHVDYWNQLGWRDPFSAPAYSSRQRAYAEAMHSRQIYTPQMIVNGTDQFVGSDRSQAERAVNAALEHAGAVRVMLQAEPEATERRETSPAETSARVAYAVTGAPKASVLQVAAVETGLVSRVSGGENAGRVLHDANVVRAFVTVPLDMATEGTVTLPLPKGTVAGHTSVVAFVQDRSTMEVLGAAAVAAR